MIIDVYNTVNTIANKNHYGLLSAVRFGYLARNAQLRIYDELADEFRRSKTRELRQVPEKKRLKLIEQALAIVYTPVDLSKDTATSKFALPSDVQNIDSVFVDNNIVDEVSWGKAKSLQRHSITSPTEESPVYTNYGTYILVYPETIGEIDGEAFPEVGMSYYRSPVDPVLSTVTNGGVEVVDPSSVVDFELPESFQDKLVMYVLEQEGIKLRESEVAAWAGKKETEEFQKSNS